jgi:RNA polymerase sigma factor (sigma-70 family)
VFAGLTHLSVSAEAAPLLNAVQRGDQQALASLYDAYSGALYGVIIRILQKEELAQEVLQDTFVKIWRSAAAYDPSKGRPFTWMMNIARNAAIDMLRSAGVKHAASIRTLDDHVYRLGHDEVRETMDGADVRGVVGKLRPEHRQLIELAYYQGFSQQEIAEGTGLPLGTVKSRTRSALLELRTLLKDHR